MILTANSKKSNSLPLECEYLSRGAMQALNCQPQPLTRHFDTRKKPKSESLRSELLQKCIFYYFKNIEQLINLHNLLKQPRLLII